MKQVLICLLYLSTVLLTQFSHADELTSIPGQYIVKFKNHQQMKVWMNSLKGNVLRVLPEHQAVLIQRSPLQLQESALAELSENPEVLWAEPNLIYRIQRTPNDPQFLNLWGLHSGSGYDIEADKAWDISTGSQKTIVAVIDTGVDYNSPEFNGNIWVNQAELTGKPGIDDDANGFIDDINGWNFVAKNNNPLDDNEHGTHVSGTIGARGNDSYGLTGVAWQVQLMPIKSFGADGTGDLTASSEAVDYAVKMGAKIINASWASAIPSKLLQESIQHASDKGVLFVACAGNTSKNNDALPMYPGGYDIENIIAVAAIDKDGSMAKFSSYGAQSVHVAAPGVNILSITPSGYKELSGTSMATPHVAGIAVLLLGAEPDLTMPELKKRILQTSRPLGSLKGRIKTGGLADAYRALTKTVDPLDPNNPEGWSQKMDLNISTPHPYTENQMMEYVVEIPGAKKIALYFKKFDTEKKYDRLTFHDRQGKILDEIDGIYSDSWSSVFNSDYVKLVFTTDKSNNDYGFDLVKAAFQ